jgi:hypothetical protein
VASSPSEDTQISERNPLLSVFYGILWGVSTYGLAYYTFRPSETAELRAKVNTCIPALAFEVGPSLERAFSPRLVEEAAGSWRDFVFE